MRDETIRAGIYIRGTGRGREQSYTNSQMRSTPELKAPVGGKDRPGLPSSDARGIFVTHRFNVPLEV